MKRKKDTLRQNKLLTCTYLCTLYLSRTVSSSSSSSSLLNHVQWRPHGCICWKCRSCRSQKISSSSPQSPRPQFECRWPHPSSDAAFYLHFCWLCWSILLRTCLQLEHSCFCISRRIMNYHLFNTNILFSALSARYYKNIN